MLMPRPIFGCQGMSQAGREELVCLCFHPDVSVFILASVLHGGEQHT